MRGLEGGLETDVQAEEISMSLDLTAAEDPSDKENLFSFDLCNVFRGILSVIMEKAILKAYHFSFTRKVMRFLGQARCICLFFVKMPQEVTI